jgi:hypothetical protein
MLDHSCQVQRHPLSERGLDLYETPDVAVQALLGVEELPQFLWEPACGRGRIVRMLRSSGRTVIGSDVQRFDDPTCFWGRDFFLETRVPDGCQGIVTNPPYQCAHDFVRHALDLCPYVAMLLRLAFLESERRSDILERGDLVRVYPFRLRLPMMHRDGWEGKKANSGMAFAWFVWDALNPGPTIVQRISWDR